MEVSRKEGVVGDHIHGRSMCAIQYTEGVCWIHRGHFAVYGHTPVFHYEIALPLEEQSQCRDIPKVSHAQVRTERGTGSEHTPFLELANLR